MESAKTTPKPESRKVLLLAVLALCAIAAGILYVLLSPEPSKPASVQTTVRPQATNASKLKLSLFASGLSNPTSIVSTQQAGDLRLFVLDRSGFIRIVTKDGKVMSEPFLDINSQVLASGEMGLLGLAFSPNYAQNGNFFVNYIDKNQNTVVAQYHANSSDKADPASGKTVLTLKQPYSNHNGGDLLFGPDGYLYIPLGDGGSAGDPQNRAQNLSSLFGKILRLDVSQLPYKIPPTNPFASQAGKAGEIWDFGLRNPWRVSFDRQTGEMYIADVGQNAIEELNIEPAKSKSGFSYGWRCYEGSAEYKTDGCTPRTQHTFPVLEYNHEDGRCSITGGYVYRGSKYPGLSGRYFYGDYCNGDIYWTQKTTGATWQQNLALKTSYQVSTFGEDSQGELYVADFATGDIYKLTAVAQ